MKKLICIVICLLMLLFSLTSCRLMPEKISILGLLKSLGIYYPQSEHIHRADHNVLENIVSATCTSKGSYDEVVYCACGEKMSSTHREIDTTPHTESAWVTDVEPTCSTAGKQHIECTVCSITLNERTTETKKHSAGTLVKENEALPTCISKGSYDEVSYCIDCGKEVSRIRKETDALSHQESEWITDVEPTCSSTGKLYKECTLCHEILSEQITSTGEHKYDNVVMEDEYCNGQQVCSIYCSVCGTYVTSYGHHYVKTVIPASCTEDGEIRYTCDICNDTYYNVIPTSGHVESEYQTVTKATCTATGSAVKTCIICDEITDRIELSKKDHSYITTANKNQITYTCSICAHSFQETVWTNILTVTFVSEGASVGTASIEEGKTVSGFPSITKNGYYLAYWAINNGTNTPYEDQCIYADTELVAVWEKEEILNAEYFDIAVFPQVDSDFTFTVNAKNESDVRNSLSIFNSKDESVAYNVRYSSNGIYEVYSSNYEPSEFYYAILGDGISFVGTESREIQFSIKGENKVSIKVSDSVKWLAYSDVYGIIEADNGMILLTNEILIVGDDVAIYKNTHDNILLVIKILSQGEMLGYNAYGIEMSDYSKVFDNFEADVSGDLSDGVFAVDPMATEAIEKEFKSSALYKKSKQAAKELASQYDITISGENIKTTIASKNGNLILTLEVEFEFEGDWSIIVSYRNEIDLGFDYHIDGFDNSSFIVTTKQYENIQFKLSYEKNEEPDKPNAKEAYSKMMDKYKEIFEKLDNKDFFDKSSNPKHESLDHISLGQIDLTIYFVVVSIDVYLDFDFEINASCGINVETVTTTSNGIRNGNLVCSRHFEITGVSMFINGKIRAACLVKIEVFAHVAGAGVFANIGVGPYFEIGGAGSMGYDGYNLYMSKFSIYLDAGIRVEANVGLKYELLGYTAFKYEHELIGKDYSFSGFPIGSKEIWLSFRTYEESVTVNGGCDSENAISIADVIDVYVKYQKLDDMFFEYKIPDDIGYSIVSISGYHSKVDLVDNKLYLDKIGEDIVITIRIRVTDSIYKQVVINYKPDHTDNCIHATCLSGSHIGGNATCTARAICERCDLEYGDMPSGHVMQDEQCVVCGYMIPSEGLEFKMLNNATYSVIGIGTFTGNVLVIPADYDGFPVSTIADNAFKNCSNITKVMIPDSVISIGKNSFYGCKNLSTAIIGNRVEQIGDYAFAVCNSLTSMMLPDSVTSLGKYAFYECKNLESVYLGNSLTSISDYTFLRCSSLTDIIIPESVTSIGSCAFQLCEKLKSVTIPSGVKEIRDYAFSVCHSLVTVVIPDTVTSIGTQAFYECYKLVSVTIGKKVTNISTDAFLYCHKLVEVVNNSSLSITKGSDKYGKVAYYAMEVHQTESKIKSIDGYLFYTCDNTTYLVGYNGEDTELVLPSYNGEEYAIYKRAFYDYDRITSVIIPDDVTSIGEYTFGNCDNLKSVTLSNRITIIEDYSFADCKSLRSITIPDNVITIDYSAFYSCSGLRTVTIGNGVEKIEKYAFIACENLTKVIIGSNVARIEMAAFQQCTYINTVYYMGTEADWAEIYISSGSANSYLTNATRYYYSESAPSSDGNYWHYNENGEIIIW